MTECNNDVNCTKISSLYDVINANLDHQNKKLDDQLTNNAAVFSTDYQRSNYKTTNVLYYKYITNILFWVYYLLVAVLIFMVGKSNSSRTMKIFIICVFVFYPFIIVNIEILAYSMGKYIYAILSGTVYTPPDF